MDHKRNREVERRAALSDKYQWMILEVSVSEIFLNSFSNQNALSHALNPFKYDERVELLEDELLTEVMKIVNNKLTHNQKQIMLMRLDGYTQMEIADALDIHQSSVHKSIMGNLYTDKNGSTNRYGGTVHKIKKLVEKNKRIQQILLEISELREEKY